MPANPSLNQTVTGHTSWDVANKKEWSSTGAQMKAALPAQIQIVATPHVGRGPKPIQGAYSTGLPNMKLNQDPFNRTTQLQNNGNAFRGRIDAMNSTGGDFSPGHQTMTSFAMRGTGRGQQQLGVQGGFPRHQQ